MPRTRLAYRALAIAMAIMTCSVLASPALAATTYSAESSAGWVTVTSVPDTFEFKVQKVYSLGLDADYWNYTVYSVNTNATATNATYYVHIHINDGATNITKNVTVAAKNDKYVYANVSYAAADWASLVASDTAICYVEVLKLASGTVASYRYDINIYEKEVTAAMVNAIMLVIPIVVFAALIGMAAGMLGKVKGRFGK